MSTSRASGRDMYYFATGLQREAIFSVTGWDLYIGKARIGQIRVW